MQTHHLNLPYLAPAQAQKHVTLNEALRHIDAVMHIAVISRDMATPPLDPAEGDRFLVADQATDVWAGHSGKIAAYQDGAWAFHIPRSGWIIWCESTQSTLIFNGTTWLPLGEQGTSPISPSLFAENLGVNTQADSVNRLAVKSDAVLLSHDDVTPGSGDLRVNVNKAGATQTAALLFQNNYAAHAEIGLTGDNDLHFKVSSDGSTFHEALQIDHQTGRVRLPQTPTAILQADHRIHCYTDNRWVSASHFYYGHGHHNGYQPSGTGADPDIHWRDLGHFLPQGARLFRLHIIGRTNNPEVEDIDIAAHINRPTLPNIWEDGGISADGQISSLALYRGLFIDPTGATPLQGGSHFLHKRTVTLNHTLAEDGFFNLYIKPKGVLSATRYFFNIYMLEYTLG